MNADELFDLALNQSTPSRANQAHRELADDPLLSDRFRRLQDALNRLMDDGDDDLEPPSDLLARTASLVEESRQTRRRTILDFVPARVPFRWGDVAVAAGIFAASLLTLLPQIQNSKIVANTAACTDNLRQLGIALTRYAVAHQSYPYTAPSASAPYAGTFALQLHDAGLLPKSAVLDCPCNGHNAIPADLPSHSDLCSMKSARSAPCLQRQDYAYNLGGDESGRPGPVRFGLNDHVPLLGDAPPFLDSVQILSGNSPVHGGKGQNVLLTGGGVRWHNTRRSGNDPDIYLNNEHRAAPGTFPGDAVLAPSITRFDGR